MTRTEVFAAARLELGDVIRSRWLPFATGIYVILAGVLVMVGARESPVIGFSGMNRVMVSFAHVLLVVLPLLALAATTQVVNRARDDGTVELLFSHPLSRSGYFVAITLTRFLVLVAPLSVLLLGMALAARFVWHEAVPWGVAARAVAVCAALLWTFTGIGLAVSTTTRNQAKAVVLGLLVWGASVALVDLALVGVMLQWHVEPHLVFALAGANPVQAARLALVSGIEPELSTLGPVGFYLHHHVGAIGLSVIGVAWPTLVGTLMWLFALRAFRRGDLV